MDFGNKPVIFLKRAVSLSRVHVVDFSYSELTEFLTLANSKYIFKLPTDGYMFGVLTNDHYKEPKKIYQQLSSHFMATAFFRGFCGKLK